MNLVIIYKSARRLSQPCGRCRIEGVGRCALHHELGVRRITVVRTARGILDALAETLAFLNAGAGAIASGSPVRHQIIARAVAVAAYGQGIEDDLAAARLGRIIDESASGLLDLRDDPAQQAVLDFLYEIGLKAAAGFPETKPEGLTWKD